MQNITLDQLIDIVKCVEQEDPIDWDKPELKESSFRMVGASVLEMFDKTEFTYDDKLILLAAVTKLTVENMILNMKLLKGQV